MYKYLQLLTCIVTGPVPSEDAGLSLKQRQAKWRWKKICEGVPHVVAQELRALTDRLIAITCLQRGQQIRALQLPEVNTFTYLRVLTRTYAYFRVLTRTYYTRTYTYLHVITRTTYAYLRLLTRTYTYFPFVASQLVHFQCRGEEGVTPAHLLVMYLDGCKTSHRSTPVGALENADVLADLATHVALLLLQCDPYTHLHILTHAYTYLPFLPCMQ